MTRQTAIWKKQLAEAIRRPEVLLEQLGLDTDMPHCQPSTLRRFPVLVPHAFARRMQSGRPDDPLLRQVFPYAEEDCDVPGFSEDPLAECMASDRTGLMRKYQGRALLITTAACAVHCRYCFRRHFPYQEYHFTRHRLHELITRLSQDPQIHELILSGGDPLCLSDENLSQLCSALTAVPHLRRLRIHSRLPIVLPDRVSSELLSILGDCKMQCVLVVHGNHANEIDDEVAAGLQKLHEAGIRLFNQSVLLAGVNDDAACLAELSERLFACRVVPYYLHLLDPVRGAGHYQLSLQRAQEIASDLRARLPGYLVPLLVREQAGLDYKLPVL